MELNIENTDVRNRTIQKNFDFNTSGYLIHFMQFIKKIV